MPKKSNRKHTVEQVEEWKKFYSECRSMEKVSAYFGVPKATVAWHLQRAGDLLDTPGRKKQYVGETDRDANRRRGLWNAYKITLKEYDQMMEAQGGVCAICFLPPKGKGTSTWSLHVDHDHTTGKVRGLLCHNCNPAIGQLKDSVQLLENAICYLRKYQ